MNEEDNNIIGQIISNNQGNIDYVVLNGRYRTMHGEPLPPISNSVQVNNNPINITGIYDNYMRSFIDTTSLDYEIFCKVSNKIKKIKKF
jgi:hypothetical protein